MENKDFELFEEFLVQKELQELEVKRFHHGNPDINNFILNQMQALLEKELAEAFQDDCNYMPNWFFPDTRGKRLWKKKLLKGGGKIIKMDKNSLMWKH